MKNYGISKRRHTEEVIYRFAQGTTFCLQYATFNKKKRESRKLWRTRNFGGTHLFRNRDSSIPVGKHYTPLCIITSDLIMRENIPQLKTGLINLLKKQYSHKFFGSHKSFDDIVIAIENMDDTLTSWYEQIEVGRFDFEMDRELKRKISYFDVYIRNINSSYLAAEFHLYLADEFQQEQIQLISKNYVSKGYIAPGFVRSGKTSGVRRSYHVVHYNNARLKSDLVYESITMFKWHFYSKIQKYFPTLIHSQNVCPPSINVYKTNISYTEIAAKNFWDSVGISRFWGQFLDESRKLFFKTELSGRYDRHDETDMVYIVND